MPRACLRKLGESTSTHFELNDNYKSSFIKRKIYETYLDFRKFHEIQMGFEVTDKEIFKYPALTYRFSQYGTDEIYRYHTN